MDSNRYESTNFKTFAEGALLCISFTAPVLLLKYLDPNNYPSHFNHSQHPCLQIIDSPNSEGDRQSHATKRENENWSITAVPIICTKAQNKSYVRIRALSSSLSKINSGLATSSLTRLFRLYHRLSWRNDDVDQSTEDSGNLDPVPQSTCQRILAEIQEENET